MKPNLQIHFDQIQPDRPGLYLSRNRNGFISVVQVTAKDIEQAQREPGWLDGLWAARLEIVNEPAKQLDQGEVLAYINSRVKAYLEVENGEAAKILIRFRDHFFRGSIAQTVEQDSLKVPVAGSIPAGPANPDPGHVREITDMATMGKDKGFEDLSEFNRLVASVDLTTPERFAAFTNWKMNDGTREGLMKLASR